MFYQHLKSSLRQLTTQKRYFVINCLGLVLALTTFFLIMLYVQDEYSYDRWLPDSERIFRYETDVTNSAGTELLIRGSVFRARRDLKNYFPEVEAATRVISYRGVIDSEATRYFETLWFVDSEFLQVFDLPMLTGSKQAALQDKFGMVVSQSMAEKYFPDGGAVGQLLTLDGERNYRISGVFADIPVNSHFDVDFLLPYDETDSGYSFGYSESWTAYEGYTYLKLSDQTDARSLANRLPEFLQAHYPLDALPAGVALPDIMRPQLRNVRDIHLHAGGINNMKPPGDRAALIAFTLIALLVLLIASVNFVSMSLSRSMERTREVAIRKVIGAQHGQLLGQFLCESLLIAVIATAAAIGLLEILLPVYNDFLGKAIQVDYLSWLTFSSVGVVTLAIIGFGSGYYPAHKMTTMQPAQSLRRGNNASSAPTGFLKTALMAFQFSISVTLVITTTVILLQQRFIGELDLGFDDENKFVIRNMNEDFAREQRGLFAQQIETLSGVTGTAFSVITPSDTVGSAFTRQVAVPGMLEEPILLYPKSVSPGFFDLYRMPLLAGRDFSEALQSEQFFWDNTTIGSSGTTPAAVINESALRAIGFATPEQAIGSTINMSSHQLTVVGVVSDAQFLSARETITPNMYIYSPADHINLTVAYGEAVNPENLLAEITDIWDQFVPEFPIVIESLEVNLEALYQQDKLQLLMMTVFSSIAIALTSIGLYAFVTQSIQQRRKEISIRKIHGALAGQLVRTIFARFSKPILIACVLAWPVAWYMTAQYLNGFQFRIEPGPLHFILASIGAVALVLSTVVSRTLKAANLNPVIGLKQ